MLLSDVRDRRSWSAWGLQDYTPNLSAPRRNSLPTAAIQMDLFSLLLGYDENSLCLTCYNYPSMSS